MQTGNKSLPESARHAKRGPKARSGLGQQELVLAYELRLKAAPGRILHSALALMLIDSAG
ncbi:hypothetical protein IQ22_04673 [Pseudomonas duriflava]|uniref:Uncharacterized protein n=1 Tax=Pseudomonas duriflava TaxID=459528 RepID=A0A562PKS6_9PSED|nr:hypothetical protein [Pseudomonas duriflava]TWI45034.1 hypothetical protein IQ22_04673 [Pseudomonas duriflava]